MKILRVIPAVLLLSAPLAWADKDVWYDASGKVVKITQAVEEKKPFVPDWKKREIERLEAQRTGNYNDRVYHRSRSSWYSGYSPYYYSGYAGHYYGGYHGHHRHHGYHSGHRSRWGFRGTYHGSGWSVRVGY
ncbi:hypothetical protein NT6N_22320 [Oceaniferula spumae]|uniref:DUF4124 domain-containing protein n=1 Tax=Oceaniferula spumae TaxID=2979115 RepID=A0AAT9FM38_9BACT